jgi:hypothetical protein
MVTGAEQFFGTEERKKTMSIAESVTQARHDRSARRAVRNRRLSLSRELATYRTPQERMEIELIACRSTDPAATEVLDILSALEAPATYPR